MSNRRTMKNLSGVPTRTRRALLPMQPSEYLLGPEQIIASPESQLQYRIERLIGQGGFGQVFLATRLGRSSSVPERICIKVSTRIDGWLREAYLGQLLDNHPRAVRLYDAFPQVRSDGWVFYCLTLEHAPNGDSRPRKDAERAARRAGAKVHGMPSVRTSVVVRGHPNKLQAAGKDAGLKLMEIKRLRAKGHAMTLLDEARFWRLVGVRPATASSKKK